MNKIEAVFFSLLYCCLLIWYSYLEMTALGTEDHVSSNLAITKASIIILSGFLYFARGGLHYKSKFSKFWVVWIVWLLIAFLFVVFTSDNRMSFLHNFFAPFCFLLVYSLCILNSASEKYIISGFIILYLFTGVYALFLSFTNFLTTIEAGVYVSNLIFWPLSAFMFITAVQKPALKYILFVPMIIFTILLAKRSAMIILSLEIVLFSLFQLKNAKRRSGKWSLLLYVLIGIMAFELMTSEFSQFTESSLARFETIQEDRGSHRLDIYNAAFKNIESFSAHEYIVGRGFGTFTETKHTNAHNDALQLFYEFGLIGLLMYIAFIILILRRLKVVKLYAKEYYIGYVFCFITILIVGLVSNLVTFNSYFAFICSYLAIAEANVYKNKRLIKRN